MIWQFLTSIIGGPLATALVKAYQAKLTAENTSEKIASDLAARELAVQQTEVQVQAQLRVAEVGKWWEPDHLFGYIMVIYFAKAVLWDKVLGYYTDGSTDPLRGDLAVWAGMIMMFYVGKRGIENVARILKR